MSLKSRIGLLVFVLLAAGIWGLAARVASVLESELEQVALGQLSNAVNYMVSDFDHKLRMRIDTLSELSGTIAPDLLGDTAKLQRLLEQRHTPSALFPLGTFIAGKDGRILAEFPRSAGRVGGSVDDRDYFGTITSGGKYAVGRPMMGRYQKQPLAALAVPVASAAGSVAGVLVGAVSLSDPLLFGGLENAVLRPTAYFTVISPKDGLVVSATDKSRILQPMAAKGANPLFDRRVEDGFEGSGRTVNSRGVDVLTASRNMKTTGWIFVAGISRAEVLAPIAPLKRQIYLAALLLSLAVLLILRLLLARQLAPLEEAGAAMRRMAVGTEPLAPLPVDRDDEIGKLLSGFNRLALERNRLEQELRRDLIILDSLPVAVSHADKSERCTFSNRLHRTFYPGDENPVGRTVREVIGEELYAQASSKIQQALAGEEVRYNREYVQANGSIGVRSVHFAPVRDAAGNVTGFYSLIEDVSERRRMDSRLRLAANVFEHASEGIVVTDSDNNITSVNRAFTEITGYSEEELIGKNPRIFKSWRHEKEFYEDMWTAINVTGHWSGELWDVRKNGESFCEYMSINAVRNEQGEVTNYCAIVSDITARKLAEVELAALNVDLERRVAQRTAELERANSELEAYTFSVSHDLRAPLRAIRGYSAVLLQTHAEECGGHCAVHSNCIDHATRIASAGERAGQIIDDLLALSRVSRQTLETSELDFSAMAGDVVASLVNAHPRRNVGIVIEPDMQITADPGLLRIVLENLVGNAWKFTVGVREARIEIGRIEGKRGETAYFVRDNGAGFDMSQKDRLFKPFERLHTVGEFEGTGVGLSIVQRIIERHEGQIWAESQIGAGSTFYFTLGN